jgi:hypothetical protein
MENDPLISDVQYQIVTFFGQWRETAIVAVFAGLR